MDPSPPPYSAIFVGSQESGVGSGAEIRFGFARNRISSGPPSASAICWHPDKASVAMRRPPAFRIETEKDLKTVELFIHLLFGPTAPDFSPGRKNLEK